MTRFQPDNSCCFCLTLRSGTAIIAVKDCVFYAATIIWWVAILYLAQRVTIFKYDIH